MRLWYWEHCTEGITTKAFLGRLKKWESAGFIDNDVWSHIGDIVDAKTIETGANTSTEAFAKLSEHDNITDGVLSCLSRHIEAPKRMEFALELLRLQQFYFEHVTDNFLHTRSNLEVGHKIS